MLTTRAGLGKAYGVVCVAAYGVATLMAQLGQSWQRAYGSEGYWLIPFNRERTYFVPLAVLGCCLVAIAAKRASPWFVIAAVVGVVSPGYGIWFWRSVAKQLGGQFSPAEFAAAVAERQAYQVAGGALVLFGLAALGLGIRSSLRQPAQPGHDERRV